MEEKNEIVISPTMKYTIRIVIRVAKTIATLCQKLLDGKYKEI